MSEAPTSPSRRERERRQRRRAMLRAAQSVFAEKGYARATLDEIAERAEFGKGTLYNYFEGGKEDILFAVFEEIYDNICRIIRKAFSEPPAPDRSLRENFHAYVEAFIDFSREREDLFMIIAKESHRLAFSEESSRTQFFIEQRNRMVNALRPALERAMERGEIQSLPPASVAHLLLANVNGMVVHQCLEEQHEDDASMLDPSEKAADFLTTMLFDGLGASPSMDSSPLSSVTEFDE